MLPVGREADYPKLLVCKPLHFAHPFPLLTCWKVYRNELIWIVQVFDTGNLYAALLNVFKAKLRTGKVIKPHRSHFRLFVVLKYISFPDMAAKHLPAFFE
ncbi:hypothetical protein AB664_14555 [Brucella anthropi]|uniref:Uncharacterized protein n=1 Tax=Brucella anthropi TaxID=529 RepID=A0A656Z743_BRUAN|nr:hypothetical protein AB664_14555 [Brucella anthropi]